MKHMIIYGLKHAPILGLKRSWQFIFSFRFIYSVWIAKVLGLLIFIQLGVWALSGIALSVMMYSEVETTPLIYKLFGTGIFTIRLSIVLVIIFKNSMFILFMLPFGFIGFILLAKRTSFQ